MVTTYDLSQNISAVETGKKISEAVVSCKLDNNILVSRILLCSSKLNAKAIQINIHLKNESDKINICFVGNSKVNLRYNCNKS